MNKSELLEKYSANLSGSKGHNHYMSYAKDFLSYVKDLDKKSITKYMEHLRRRGMSPGTVNFAFRVVRRLFIVNGIKWPFNRGESPLISQRDEDKPALSIDYIRTMIDAAKDKRLPANESAFLSLSTIYGLRREEMVNLKPQDISFRNNTIYVATLKHGRQRYHLIPPEIKPYLQKHDFNTKYSLTIMSQMFWRIVNHCELVDLKQHRLGWHTIRRSLLSGLIDNGLNPFAAGSFMRWKGTTGVLAMPARYYSNVVIGAEGKETVIGEAESDREIFEKHPLLELWR